MKFAAKALMVVCAATLLSGCSNVMDGAMFWRAEKPEPCPRVTVLKNASELTRFKEGPGRDLIDVLFEAKVTDVLNVCTYDVDYDTRAGEITAQVSAVIAGRRGPADTTRSASLDYFIAVVDADRNIVQKSIFPLKIGFPGNLTHNTVKDEPVDLTITTDGSTDGRDYEIYVGFQLSREEMAYNKKLSER